MVQRLYFFLARRFGKTLNLSMLRYFYEKQDKDTNYLFSNLYIYEHEEYMQKQGQYPVIYITFKDIKDSCWDDSFSKIKELLFKECTRHKYLLDSDTLTSAEKERFNKVIIDTALKSEYETILSDLSEYLTRYHGKKAVILIDEYDTPIHSSYLYGFYNDMINFMRNFLCSALKDNNCLEKAVLTGILRVAKESIFSALNNLKGVCQVKCVN